jgi:hypothetical protein
MEILTLRPLLHRRPTRFSPRYTHSISPALLAQPELWQVLPGHIAYLLQVIAGRRLRVLEIV